ncbi:MAG: type II toxin-antitoxin system VapC family toxin, partial [Desulfobacterales bacterium]|nr:type II toxin-antitoxin system VapC family toxin [Desulfobacterales bacterium]
MIILPDTNVWIKMLIPGKTPVKNHFRKTRSERIRFCSVVKAELYFGAYNSGRQKENLDLLKRLFQNYDSLPFNDPAAKIYGRIRAELNARGTPIGP